jgi:hypothetical protein
MTKDNASAALAIECCHTQLFNQNIIPASCFHGRCSTTPDTVNGTAAIHWRPRPDRFASCSTGYRAWSEHDTGPCDATSRIIDVLTVDYRARGFTGDSDTQETQRSTERHTGERQ